MEPLTNTFLITGGSSGIGLELARKLIQKKNRVIICGRSSEKLNHAKNRYPSLITRQCDLANLDDCISLAKWVSKTHPDCNVLVNNAAVVHRETFLEDESILEKIQLEIDTNILAPIILTKLLLPVLLKNNRPEIITISSGLAYVPRSIYPFYNASKAALHSFTQVLRNQLEPHGVDVTEVFFPAVNTPWHKGNPPKIAIPVETAVEEMLKGLKKKKKEIHVRSAKTLYYLSRIAPGFAFKKINSLS